LPPGWSSNNGTQYGALHFFILPYVEQDAVYRLAGNNSANLGYNVPIKPYNCPSDASQWTSYPNGGTNYAWNVMVFSGGQQWGADQKPGSFIQAMPDGTANTVIWAERYKLCQPSSGGHTDPVWAAHPWNTPNGPWAVASFGYTQWSNNSNGYVAAMTSGNLNGYYPDITSRGQGPGGNIAFQASPTAANCNWYVTQGAHSTTMMTALGDGSVRAVSTSMSLATWSYACHPSDGNAMGSDW
jgi:hypothetical protein